MSESEWERMSISCGIKEPFWQRLKFLFSDGRRTFTLSAWIKPKTEVQLASMQVEVKSATD